MPKKSTSRKKIKKKKTSSKKRTSSKKKRATNKKKPGVIDKKKLELYVEKLYKGLLLRYKKKLREDSSYPLTIFYREERKRKPTGRYRRKTVLENYNDRCVICSKRLYDRDDTEIHHIDGDRSNTQTKNLVPMCKRCHTKVTRLANTKLQDYKVRQDRRRPRSILDQFYKPPKYKPPKFKWY